MRPRTSTRDQGEWKATLARFVEFSSLKAERCPILSDRDSGSKIRMICLADAATNAGGAAINVGRKVNNSSHWSCSLIAAKSKLLSATIPRNELSAIMLMTELGYIVKKALGNKVDEIIYITDSTIALSWCHNINKNLRAFVISRVETSRCMIQWTLDSDEIPLYHFEGTLILSDMLTRPATISVDKVSIGSEWQTGMEWMKLETADMPLTRYTQISIDKSVENEISKECFEEPFALTSDILTHSFSTLSPIAFKLPVVEERWI